MDNHVISKLLDRLSNVSIIAPLKEGGQKTVFKAHHTHYGDVVLKVVVPSDNSEKERALREINIASGLTSNLFARLYDFGEFADSGQCVLYILEELIPGENLREIIIAHLANRIPVSETRRIMDSLMNALTITEPLNLVHRDIKPENVIVGPERIVLIDFGIARHLDMISITNTFEVFGPMTPGYAPPEQIRNEKRKISIRTDLFSLAVLFYELITGVNPFHIDSVSPVEAITNTLTVHPRQLVSWGCHPSFDSFISQCMEKNCHRRPANMTHAMRLYNQIVWEV